MNKISGPEGTRAFMVKYFIFIKVRKKPPKGGNTVVDSSQLIRQIFPLMRSPVKKNVPFKSSVSAVLRNKGFNNI